MNISSNEEMGIILNNSQEQFCQNYVCSFSFRSNATLSYADAYEYDLDILSREELIGPEKSNSPLKSDYQRVYDNCSAHASRLLKNDKIKTRIIDLLNCTLSNNIVDSELARLILQDDNLSTKLGGIREYNKLKGRIKEPEVVKPDYSGSIIILPAREDENGVMSIDYRGTEYEKKSNL